MVARIAMGYTSRGSKLYHVMFTFEFAFDGSEQQQSRWTIIVPEVTSGAYSMVLICLRNIYRSIQCINECIAQSIGSIPRLASVKGFCRVAMTSVSTYLKIQGYVTKLEMQFISIYGVIEHHTVTSSNLWVLNTRDQLLLSSLHCMQSSFSSYISLSSANIAPKLSCPRFWSGRRLEEG